MSKLEEDILKRNVADLEIALRTQIERAEAAEYIDQLEKQRDELLAALKYARELVDDWGAYASAYMQEKHDLAGDIDRLDAAIAKAESKT